jgi:hypothetical protein
MLVARLHAPVHKEGVKYTGLYSVEFDGEIGSSARTTRNTILPAPCYLAP